jgi:hypothetical protein
MIKFRELQTFLENTYGINTLIDVREFIRPLRKLDNLGKLIIDQSNQEEPNVALLLDQDIFEAWSATHPTTSTNTLSESNLNYSVVYEELSHFVYFAYNHQRGRNITALEMEAQSEIDRLLLAFHSDLSPNSFVKNKILNDVLDTPYSNKVDPRYEESRIIAKKFLLGLSSKDPSKWSPPDFVKIRGFFHTDLSGKIELSNQKKKI